MMILAARLVGLALAYYYYGFPLVAVLFFMDVTITREPR